MTKAKKKTARKDPNVYPPGWDYDRVKAVIDYYDNQQEEDVLAEIVVAQSRGETVWMEIPQDLLPQVRKLLARHKRPA